MIIAADRRGEGIGEVLVEAVTTRPELRQVGGLSLLRRDGPVPYYESVGFERFDPHVEIPGGGTEELIRTTHHHDG